MSKGGGGGNNIDIFLRLKPVNHPSPKLNWDPIESIVAFNVPKTDDSGYVNNQRELYEFKFNGILGPDSKQDEVFDRVARPVVMAALEGVNGTVFAYGQTGSGKTFTITGGAERYADRGIIPRAISLLFQELSKRSDAHFSVQVSYLEIYNEAGYDLLDPGREISDMEDLPRVHAMEDEEGAIHLRNLSAHSAGSEEEALNLLFLGDTNRTIAETPMNMASSRSHCVFTVHIESRKPGEDIVRRSKMHLVDLAGSERVSKTNVDGSILKEAKFINLSLHYLEQVIIALQERSLGQRRQHIPYRNSMMTMVLRDSLGGNCKTTMIATATTAGDQLDESISTCRFAQRVAMVANNAQVNEELDPSLIIRRLKQEVKDLRDELRLHRGEDARGPLTQEETAHLRRMIGEYVKDPSPDAVLNLGGSIAFIKAAFEAFRGMLRDALQGRPPEGVGGAAAAGVPGAKGAGGALVPGAAGGGGAADSADLKEQIRQLRLQLQLRDNEIQIMVQMLAKREGPGAAAARGSAPPAPGPTPQALAAQAALQRVSNGQGASTSTAALPPPPPPPVLRSSSGALLSADPIADLMDPAVLADRAKAFELFRRSYRKNEAIEENKQLLKVRYDEAKRMGAEVNDAKGRIQALKTAIEQRRIQRSVGGLADGSAPDSPDADEDRLRREIDGEKTRYRTAFESLKDLKQEIDNIQMLLEKSRKQLTKDFEQWLELMQRQQGGAPGPVAQVQPPAPAMAAPQLPVREAWGGASVAGSSVASSMQFRTSQAPAPAPIASVRSSSSNGAPGAPLDVSGIDPAVLQAAKPLLTGNVEADRDILRFYVARQNLLKARQEGGGA